MSTTAVGYSTSSRDLLSRLVRAGLLTGVVDGLFSSVLNVVAYRSTASRLFQGGLIQQCREPTAIESQGTRRTASAIRRALHLR